MKLKFLVLLIFTGLLRASAQEVSDGEVATGQQSSSSQPPAKSAETNPPGSERVFGVVRTFGITNDKDAVPLTPRGKFRIFTQNVTDPFTFVGMAIQAGIGQATNEFPSYGQGMSGYAKRYGASFADFADAEFMGTFAFPALLRQDPRYFRQGEGTFKGRLGHSLASAFVTRKDSGGRTFNWSNTLGGIAAGSISMIYYPAENRGAGLVFSRAGIGILFGTAGAVFSEFGPDLQRKLFKKKNQ